MLPVGTPLLCTVLSFLGGFKGSDDHGVHISGPFLFLGPKTNPWAIPLGHTADADDPACPNQTFLSRRHVLPP